MDDIISVNSQKSPHSYHAHQLSSLLLGYPFNRTYE